MQLLPCWALIGICTWCIFLKVRLGSIIIVFLDGLLQVSVPFFSIIALCPKGKTAEYAVPLEPVRTYVQAAYTEDAERFYGSTDTIGHDEGSPTVGGCSADDERAKDYSVDDLLSGIETGEVASFPGSPSFRAIIPFITFDPPEGKAEGEPGRFCHMTSIMLRHSYVSYRRGRTGLAPVPLLGIS